VKTGSSEKPSPREQRAAARGTRGERASDASMRPANASTPAGARSLVRRGKRRLRGPPVSAFRWRIGRARTNVYRERNGRTRPE
jgi:hypothetical protein